MLEEALMTTKIQTWTRIGMQACFLSIAIFLLAGFCFGQAADWTEFHWANIARWNSNENVLNVNNVGSLGLKWTFTTG